MLKNYSNGILWLRFIQTLKVIKFLLKEIRYRMLLSIDLFSKKHLNKWNLNYCSFKKKFLHECKVIVSFFNKK